MEIFSEFVMFCNNSNPSGNYMFTLDNRNTITRCVICSKLTIKTPERRQWLLPTNCLSEFDFLVGLALKGSNTKLPEIPGVHLIKLIRMPGWADFGVTQWFESETLYCEFHIRGGKNNQRHQWEFQRGKQESKNFRRQTTNKTCKRHWNCWN